MSKKSLNRLFSLIASISILANTVSAPLIAYAQEAPLETLPVVEEAPTLVPTQTPAPEPTVEAAPAVVDETPTESVSVDLAVDIEEEVPVSVSTPMPEMDLTEPQQETSAELVPSIWTDDTDYAPTETVTISGKDFTVNSDLTVKVTWPDSVVRDSAGVVDATDTVATDDNGSFVFFYSLRGEGQEGKYLAEILMGTEVLATTTFTDSRDILSITVNGGNSVSVAPGANVNIGVTVRTDWWLFGDDNWRSTSWRLGNSGPWTCVNHSDHNSEGTNTEYFNIPAPITVGTYDLQLRAHSNDSCSNGTSNTQTLDNAIVVQQPQTSNPPLSQSCGLDIALLADVSTSINSAELGQIKTALTNFVNAFTGTPTVFSLSRFGTVGQVLNGFSMTPAQAATAVGSLSTFVGTQYTNWDDGLAKAYGTFDPRLNPNLIVIATDGNPNKYGNPAQPSGSSQDEAGAMAAAITRANTIRGNDTRIVAIGIGGDLNISNLQAITGPVVAPPAAINENVDVITSNFDTLGAAMAELASGLCGGTINITKLIDGQPQSGWNFSTNIQPGQGTILPPSGQTGQDGMVQFDVDVTGETASVDVIEAQDHPGYSLESATCYINNQPAGIFDGNDSVTGISMGRRDIVSCIFNNIQNGAFFGTKWEDLDGDRNMAGEETGIFGWTIFIDESDDGVLDPGEIFQSTDENGSYQFADLPAGSYSVCEVEHDDMIRTYPADSNCQEAVVIAGQTNGSYDFGNMPAESTLEITKSNDKAAAAAGDTVTYTLVVKNTGKSTLEVNVVDVLPGGFTYILGTARKNDEVALFEPDLVLLTSGILSWNVGFLGAGDEVKITYQAKISSDISLGTYKNLATCEGFFRSQEGQGDPAAKCDTVDSSVSIGESLNYGGSLTPQVLGLSTEVLPATGSESSLALFALIVGGFGVFTKIKAYRLGRRKNAKN